MKVSSPERFSDEEILMTLKMSTGPSETPGGFFDFPDPSQETTPLPSNVGFTPARSQSPNLDFIADFEMDLDSSFELLRGGVIWEARESDTTAPAVQLGSSFSAAPSLSGRAPSMPTIFEEDGEEEEEDVAITPSEAQRALLPHDQFSRPRLASQTDGVANASEDDGEDLDTPRPRGKCLIRWSLRSLIIIV